MAASKRRRHRLLLVSATIVLLLAAATSNRAQSSLDITFHAFQDSRGVTVLSPDGNVTKELSDRTTFKARLGVDAISAASASCARCHPDGATNGRVVLAASATRKYGDTKFTFGGELSREMFYTATTGLASVSRDFHKGNTNLAGGLAYSLNRPQLHPDETRETQHSVDAFASLTQSWTKRTITQVGYELNQINGYQTSPFLRTSVNGVMTLGHSPDARTRHAVSFRLRQALGPGTFMDADYRWYHDTWALDSNAISAGLSHRFGSSFMLAGSYRHYSQTGTFFYAPAYFGTPEYYTGDFRLFPFDSNMMTGRIELSPKGRLFAMPKGTVLTLQYERYGATTDFQSAIFTGGVRIPLK